jgi:two-component system sensor histidine kinase CpxA
MNARPRFPLIVKLLGWLLLHLLLLALAFFSFVFWQLGLGLDSLLSGAAGDRLSAFAVECREEMLNTAPDEWETALTPLAARKSLTAILFDPSTGSTGTQSLPANIHARATQAHPRRPNQGPPSRPRPGRLEAGNPERPPPTGGPGSPRRQEIPRPHPPPREVDPDSLPAPRPLFLMRADRGDGYWAGILLPMPGPRGDPPRHELLLIRSATIGANGMFFDLKPWLWGGLGVLSLSLLFWAPFVLAITRYVRRLTAATGEIAAGRFKVSLPPRSDDELGQLGTAIQAMADRLDHLVAGQKRFLGDAAHELCAPLARLRTGLGILDHQIPPQQRERLDAIDQDAAELASLIAELLEFSRAGSAAPTHESVELLPLLQEIIARSDHPGEFTVEIPNGSRIQADRRLITRALRNLVHNATLHAGPAAHITIAASKSNTATTLIIADNGPGVPPQELSRLFEPFYRPDRSRSRDTGGTGLGLAIVQAAIEACGGKVSAELPPSGGFAVRITFPEAAGKSAETL